MYVDIYYFIQNSIHIKCKQIIYIYIYMLGGRALGLNEWEMTLKIKYKNQQIGVLISLRL